MEAAAGRDAPKRAALKLLGDAHLTAARARDPRGESGIDEGG
jgi:hypothetical protein